MKARKKLIPFALQHDAQLDYYGKRLATCSSDRSVRIFDVVEGQQQTASRTPGSVLKGFVSPSRICGLAHMEL
jgi:protein transport protein SEC13